MATIRKRGNTYQIRVSNGYDRLGNQVSQSMTWKPAPNMTEKQVQKELQRQSVLFEEACMKGQVSSAVKFGEFAEQWFTEYAEIKLKPLTIRGYRWIEPRVNREIGHLRLDRITLRHIQKMVLTLSEEKRQDGKSLRNGKLSSKSIKLHISFISTIFDYAMKMQLVSSNPCRNAALPKPDTPEREIYTIEEAQQVLDLLKLEEGKNYKYYVFYALAMCCGMRLGEILGLEWSDCDFRNNIIEIKRTSSYCQSQGGTYTDTPKIKTSRRSLKV
jgi:integrase